MKFFIHFFFILFLTLPLFAENSRLRIFGLGGLGSATIATEGNADSIESPFAFSANIDYLLSSQIDLGAEHMRTLSANGTTLGLTGITIKYYYLYGHPIELLDSKHIDMPTLQFQAWSPYAGMSLGFAQASVLSTTINTVSVYLNLKLGVDYPMTSIWGFRGEINAGTSTVGTGSVQFFNSILGFYLFL